MLMTRLFPQLSCNGNNLLRTAVPTCITIRNFRLKKHVKDVHCDYVDSMDYGIYALNTGYIRESCIEAGRIGIVRKAKTKEMWKPVCESPFTKRPVGTRMGKGKGKVSHWAAKAIAGQRLFEFNAANDLLAEEAYTYLRNIMPVHIELRIKPKQPKKVLNANELLEVFEMSAERARRMEAYAKL